jgi:hypothetical protein
MTAKILTAAAVFLAVSTTVQAQVPPLNFDQAAYVTCRDAHAMQPQARQALTLYLADHAARHRGVVIPEAEQGAQLAYLVRGGCTLAPDAYLFTVIDRALVAELAKLPKRQ